jgi:hypothetical protein
MREDMLRFLWIFGVRRRNFETHKYCKCDLWKRRKGKKINKPLVWQTPSHKLKAAGKWRKKWVADGSRQSYN